jgi:putative PIN family toxin of toxin-antitoxin system
VRIVFDTNVLLAAFGYGGVCRELFDLSLASHQIVTCEFILNEFERNLRAKFGVADDVAVANIEFLQVEAELVEPVNVSAEVCRDPDDLPVLGTLLAARADCLVTGDRDLLTLDEFTGHPIFSPRQLLNRLQRSSPPSGP